MKNLIIAQVPESDRNIYITIMDGELYSVNYSQGIDDIDIDFLTMHDSQLTQYVYHELELGDELYSPENFFPSPYWDQQVRAIDNAICKRIREENERSEIIEQIEKLEKQLSKLKNRL